MTERLRRAKLLSVSLVAASLVGGCGKRAATTSASAEGPDAVAAAFDKDMRNNDVEAAAKLFAYDTIARARNEDWDSIPAGQRRLILARVRDDRVTELARIQPVYVNGGYAPGPAQASGPRASVAFQGQSGTMTMTLVREGDAWKILQVQ